ncbi:MAG: exodeoxyribonuclease VII large subunit [Rhodothermales bacterium]
MEPVNKQTSDILSVGEFAKRARQFIEHQFGQIWIEGEISNFKQYSSGHCYFTLKDRDAQVRCVMWKNTAMRLYFTPADGMLVRLYGKASFYEKRGDFQVVAQSLRHAGEGTLQQAFEALKQKLASEGLFDDAHKKSKPLIPERIGIITSGSGAAIQDVLSILGRRFPITEALVCPVQVQGAGSAKSICEAIEAFNQIEEDNPLRADLLIVGRGGGSLEDLWSFNEEIVARAIFASEIPIISAVGHESDFTIADYVADFRAATPSMAAEIAVPNQQEIKAFLRGCMQRSKDVLFQHIDQQRLHIEHLTQRHAFNRPVDQLYQIKQRTEDVLHRLERSGKLYLKHQQDHVNKALRHLQLLDPVLPLKKGYSLVEQDGVLIRSAKQLETNSTVALRFHDGSREAIIHD